MKYVPAIIASIIAKFEQMFLRAFWKYFETKFKNHKNSEHAIPTIS